MFTHLSNRDAFAGVHLTTSRTHPELRWYTPREGRYPETAQEIVLTDDTAGLLGVGVGETVTLNLPHALPLVVVGLTDERGYNDPPAYGMHSLTPRPTPSSRRLTTASSSTRPRPRAPRPAPRVGVWGSAFS